MSSSLSVVALSVPFAGDLHEVGALISAVQAQIGWREIEADRSSKQLSCERIYDGKNFSKSEAEIHH